MKIRLFILIFVSISNLSAQKIKGFGSVGAFLSTNSFQKSTYGNGGFGLEYNLNSFFRPEVEIAIFTGVMQNIDNIDYSNGYITDSYKRSFWATNLSFSPKFTINISTDFERISNFQIMPRLNFTRTVAEGKLYVLNDKKTSLDFAESERIIDFSQSIGIGVGVYFELSDKKSDAIAFNLYYHNINFGKDLSDLKHAESKIETHQVIGFGLNYYFGFVKKKRTQ